MDKLDLKQIRNKLDSKKGKAYWRSLEELADTDEFQEFLHKEFPRQAGPMDGDGLSRREFVKLMGASLALAGLSSCVGPPYRNEKIMPYVRAPEEIIPGEPLHYASALSYGGYARGVLVTSHQGRPTKIEGNPDHPASLGATDAVMQAETLSLYDPDRSQQVLRMGEPSDWATFQSALGDKLPELEAGAGLRILTETVTSPTLADQIRRFLRRYPEAQWHQYDAAHHDSIQQGAELAFGEPVASRLDFSQADVIVSLDADFLGSGPAKVRYTKDFSRRRRVYSAEDDMNRLYVIESSPTLTGTLADHRMSVRPSSVEAAARQLAQALGIDTPTGEMVLSEAWLEALADDLGSHRGRSLVIAGDEQPAIVHALAHAINHALGNVGATVTYSEPVEAEPVMQLGSLKALVDDMNAGEVKALVMLGGNPVYTAPADYQFAEALVNVPMSVHLSLYQDETSQRVSWHVPHTHELEAWGDARAYDGTATIMQPLIAPFYGGKSPLELMATLLGEAGKDSYQVIEDFYRPRAAGDFDHFWRQTVYQGVIPGTALPPKEVTLRPEFLSQTPSSPVEGLELTFRPDPSVLDGRYSNNGWLQELPKPLTKLTWDNAVYVGPRTAERFNLSTRDVLELHLGGRSVKGAVWVLPGQAEDTFTVHFGYGRDKVGHISEDAGFNAYALRGSDAPWNASGLEIRKTGEQFQLVSTQMHHALEEDRHLVRYGTLAELQAEPDHPHFVHPGHEEEADLYTDWEYPNRAWGMVIDMNVCTGCNACVTACQAENNIPIVGKRFVANSREMHWIRIDNYYGGDIDNPRYYHQPLACMHCEQAPCEPVCPVGATVHDSEGLNVMVYNRCVGTRYCSNNCPYKVRRYNYLQYAELEENALAMLQNPNVTVRSRGVMEKCTYCVQRIKASTIKAGREQRTLQDGEIVTACQAACPAEAIVFGDINDENSQVSRVKASPLDYGLLTELNTVPRTSYLAKLTNPHPALEPSEAHHSDMQRSHHGG